MVSGFFSAMKCMHSGMKEIGGKVKIPEKLRRTRENI
jgi:hypothetical protein